MKFLFLKTFILLQIMTCQAQQDQGMDPPPTRVDGWSCSSPSAEGFKEDSLRQLFRLIRETPPRDFRALTVSKNGKLVIDQYFNSFNGSNIHDIRSAGKSITSLLACMAMDKGFFKLDDQVTSFFSKYDKGENFGKGKENITVKDLFIMSSGLASDDYLDSSPGTESLMTQSDDYLNFIWDLPMDFEPGKRFAYSSAVAFLLGSMVEETSGKTLEEFAQTHLFGPLQIDSYFWQKSPQGRTIAMGNLYMTGRDVLKIGQLMLDQGDWNGQQLLSSKWVNKSTQNYLDITRDDPFAHGYGFMWYLAKIEIFGREIDYYFASGNGGNKIFVVPSLDMVIATLSSAYGQGYGQRRSHNILERVLQAALVRE